jgi:hypothetical protein
MSSSSRIKLFDSINRIETASSSLQQNSLVSLNKISSTSSTNKLNKHQGNRLFYGKFLQTVDMTGQSSIEGKESKKRHYRHRRRLGCFWPYCCNCCCACLILALALFLCGLVALLVALLGPQGTTTTTTTTTSEFHYYCQRRNSRHSVFSPIIFSRNKIETNISVAGLLKLHIFSLSSIKS